MKENGYQIGRIIRISGPVIGAVDLEGVHLYDVVYVGELRLVGEVIRLASHVTTIQVYEETAGIRVGEPVYSTGRPMMAELGPGLLGMVYDGLQRPLAELAGMTGDFIQRGTTAPPLRADARWPFAPCVDIGQYVRSGDVLGAVPEGGTIEHLIMVPPGWKGQVVEARRGDFGLDEPVVVIEAKSDGRSERREIALRQRWPIRVPRPIRSRLAPREPLVTGTRVIDALFPVAKGGSAIIPGGFGTGKTVAEHSLARWADVDIVVYVGCGERGNEMTAVLEEFPLLEDPRTGAPLMERTVLIANTSNMPVAAREASIYTGITIAEYYRDMGYDVLMLADSTSRWGEALREISGRLEEMPGEEGYPAYLGARLAEFYERSGRVSCLGWDSRQDDASTPRSGSVTVVGAVSPPGGDFSEPMTQGSMRITGTFWALDYSLSRRRHFPAIHWARSYSLYDLHDWFADNVGDDWIELVGEATALLQREAELLEIVQLVGPDALAEPERAVLTVARMVREDFLHQSAYDPVDRFCPLDKGYWMLKAILDFHHRVEAAVKAGVLLERIIALPVVADIARMKDLDTAEAVASIQGIMERISISFSGLGVD
jgi:V/A-type H+-transporting ATPase subunit A